MKWITLLLIGVLCLFYTETSEEPVPIKPNTPYVPRFNKTNLISYLKYKKVQHPQIAYAQSVIETGNFTSTIFKENNNLFGMRYVGKYKRSRPTYAVGEQHKHAVYLTWVESVEDYILWQKMFKKTKIETQQEYLKLLHKVYAEDTSYVSIIKYMIKQDTVQWK